MQLAFGTQLRIKVRMFSDEVAENRVAIVIFCEAKFTAHLNAPNVVISQCDSEIITVRAFYYRRYLTRNKKGRVLLEIFFSVTSCELSLVYETRSQSLSLRPYIILLGKILYRKIEAFRRFN